MASSKNKSKDMEYSDSNYIIPGGPVRIHLLHCNIIILHFILYSFKIFIYINL